MSVRSYAPLLAARPEGEFVCTYCGVYVTEGADAQRIARGVPAQNEKAAGGSREVGVDSGSGSSSGG